LDHDFLWRTTQCLPERGRIGIFNRSYYEEVLIVRVHPELLLSQRLPDGAQEEKSVWQGRYRSIRDMESHLYRSGTRIIKFFLHLSKEEQRKRFLARIDEPDKNWKFSMGDMKEREIWNDYMKAYEACLSATSTRHAPWYVVPADDKANARLIVSQIILDTLEGMPIDYPKLSDEKQKELRSIRNCSPGKMKYQRLWLEARFSRMTIRTHRLLTHIQKLTKPCSVEVRTVWKENPYK
jgi:PPK2 family polyphosphate:nucleotide phosphotransferase